jgi:prephenate dehydrogenase
VAAPDPGAAPFARVGIAGLGLIGGSIALALRRTWPAVRVVGVDGVEVIDAAQSAGLIDGSAAEVSELTDADLIILAAPIPAILESIAALGRAKARAVVTDVGSTKRRIVAAAAAAGLQEFVGGHPMAGRERSGLAAAEATLFEGRPWFLSRGTAGEDALARVKALVRGLGASAVLIDPERHDRTMAYVSHLPQIAATTLMAEVGAAVGPHGLACAGQGLDDMTRLAASPADVWTGILATNADFIAEAGARVAAALGRFSQQLEDNDAVEATFETANRLRGILRGSRMP